MPVHKPVNGTMSAYLHNLLPTNRILLTCLGLPLTMLSIYRLRLLYPLLHRTNAKNPWRTDLYAFGLPMIAGTMMHYVVA
jgi:hypothetical protein